MLPRRRARWIAIAAIAMLKSDKHLAHLDRLDYQMSWRQALRNNTHYQRGLARLRKLRLHG